MIFIHSFIVISNSSFFCLVNFDLKMTQIIPGLELEQTYSNYISVFTQLQLTQEMLKKPVEIDEPLSKPQDSSAPIGRISSSNSILLSLSQSSSI